MEQKYVHHCCCDYAESLSYSDLGNSDSFQFEGVLKQNEYGVELHSWAVVSLAFVRGAKSVGQGSGTKQNRYTTDLA